MEMCECFIYVHSNFLNLTPEISRVGRDVIHLILYRHLAFSLRSRPKDPTPCLDIIPCLENLMQALALALGLQILDYDWAVGIIAPKHPFSLNQSAIWEQGNSSDDE